MEQNKVLSVFDGAEMQKYFLLMTKKAEETVYLQLPDDVKDRVTMEDFLEKVKENRELKKIIQDMILVAIGNSDWVDNMLESLAINYNQIGEMY